MALTPFDMEGVNRDLLAAGNPAKPDMQSILRRNARDLVLGNAILVSSADAKELEFGVHMAYSDADGGFDTDPSEDVWFEASSLPIPNERPDLPPDNALRIRVTDVLTEYGFTDIDVKAPDRTPEGIWIGLTRFGIPNPANGTSTTLTTTTRNTGTRITVNTAPAPTACGGCTRRAARRSRSMPSRTNPVKPITGWRPALCVISSMDPSRRSPRTGTRWEATR